jgi:hypothetical protein
VADSPPTYGTIRRHGVDRKWCAQLDERHRVPKPPSVPTVHSGRSHPSWGFPRKSNGDDHRGNGEEQTGECLLQRNEVDLTTPDEERSAQGVKDARHSQSRLCPNQGNDQKHSADEPKQDRETGGSHEGGTIRGISVQCLCRRCLTPQVATSDARLNESRATKSRRQIHLRYDRDDRPDQRGTTETTAGQQNKHRAHAKNRQPGPSDAGDQVTDKELTGSDKACVALEIGLNCRLLPNRAQGQE